MNNQEWQCPWCKWIININRERIREEEAVREETRHMICNICKENLYKKLREIQERQEKNKRKKWRKIIE